jgi:excisionase family DNA binding protein
MFADSSQQATETHDRPMMLTVREASRRLTISLTSTYQLIRSGKLPHYRIGAAIRISDTDIAAFLAQYRREPVTVRTPPPRPRLKHIKL